MSENETSNTSTNQTLEKFKPTLSFLIRFGLIYGIGSLLYSLFIAQYDPHPDPATILVSKQMASTMTTFGQDVTLYDVDDDPYVGVMYKGEYSVSVFEGCNGLAVMILFIAFVVAFRGNNVKALVWFIPLGLVLIHFFNILRLGMLIIINYYYTSMFHFYHKFLFTGIIYMFVLLLWVLWVRIQQSKSTPSPQNLKE
jgi:exosortase family protein XrtF